MVDQPQAGADLDDRLEVGAKVEVRDRFGGSWSTGFTVEEVTTSGYRLRRRSDGRVLPREFVEDTVRKEHKSMWWV